MTAQQALARSFRPVRSGADHRRARISALAGGIPTAFVASPEATGSTRRPPLETTAEAAASGVREQVDAELVLAPALAHKVQSLLARQPPKAGMSMRDDAAKLGGEAVRTHFVVVAGVQARHGSQPAASATTCADAMASAAVAATDHLDLPAAYWVSTVVEQRRRQYASTPGVLRDSTKKSYEHCAH